MHVTCGSAPSITAASVVTAVVTTDFPMNPRRDVGFAVIERPEDGSGGEQHYRPGYALPRSLRLLPPIKWVVMGSRQMSGYPGK